MYACNYVYIYIFIHDYTHTHTYICIYIYIHVNTCVLYAYIYIYRVTHSMHEYIYIYIYVHKICVYMYVHIYPLPITYSKMFQVVQHIPFHIPGMIPPEFSHRWAPPLRILSQIPSFTGKEVLESGGSGADPAWIASHWSWDDPHKMMSWCLYFLVPAIVHMNRSIIWVYSSMSHTYQHPSEKGSFSSMPIHLQIGFNTMPVDWRLGLS